jgi:hypothetical protein
MILDQRQYQLALWHINEGNQRFNLSAVNADLTISGSSDGWLEPRLDYFFDFQIGLCILSGKIHLVHCSRLLLRITSNPGESPYVM